MTAAPVVPPTTTRRVLVIGAGLGGLAAAIRLQAAGHAVTLVDNRDRPGGRAYVYQRDGFVFDGGPTVITDPSALAELFELTGRSMADYVELIPVTPFYQLCWEDGRRFDYSNDSAELERQIAQFNPADVAGYREFYQYSQAVFEEGYLRLGTVPFLHFRDMLAAAPQLAKLAAYKSVYSKVSDYISDEHLRQAFSFHSLLVGGNPFSTSAIYTLIHALERHWGVWFARGGTGALVAGLARLFTDLGGTLRLDTDIVEIQTNGNRAVGARAADGWQLACDLVVSNADVVHTYRQLLGHHPRGRDYGAKLAGKRHSMSLFVIYFGLRAQHPQLKHHMVLFGPRYRELIQEIFSGPHLPDDFSLYLHAPSVTDASLAPPGCSSYYVLAPVPHLGKAAIDWDQTGPVYADKILSYLEAHYIPNLKRDLATLHTLTPFGFRDELHAHLGSAFSVEPILTQSAWFRPHNRDAVIENLYIVGAGTHPGAGIPGVVGSAKATAQVISQDLAGA